MTLGFLIFHINCNITNKVLMRIKLIGKLQNRSDWIIWINLTVQPGSPGDSAQDPVQVIFEYLQGKRAHNLFGATCGIAQLPSQWKMCSDVQMEPPTFQFVPIVSRSVTGHHWEQPTLTLLSILPSTCYICW